VDEERRDIVWKRLSNGCVVTLQTKDPMISPLWALYVSKPREDVPQNPKIKSLFKETSIKHDNVQLFFVVMQRGTYFKRCRQSKMNEGYIQIRCDENTAKENIE
jgi:hypothetical protein